MGARAAVFRILAERWLTVWIGQLARAALDRSRSAPPGSRDHLIYAGMYSGMLGRADELGAGSWGLARRMFPAPPAAPTARHDIHLYLGGYLNGNIAVTLAHRRAAMHQPFWDRRWNEAVLTYGSVIASPEAQSMLAMPTQHAVNKAHQFAGIVAARTGKQVPDPELEVMLFRWLANRSGIALPEDLEAYVARLRLRRERLRPGSAPESAAS